MMSKEYKIPKNIKPQDLARAIINASYWHWKTIDKVQHTEAITYLNSLESIDNAKPNEAIECLEKIKDSFGCDMAYYDLNKEYETVELALLKTQGLEKEYNRLKGQFNYLTEVVTEFQKILKIIKEKGFDESIKNYDNYAIWVEYKTEQFAKAIEKNPTILNWDVFDKVIYTEEEYELVKRCL